MTRTYAKDTLAKIGKDVKICGWVDVVRNHGKLIFLDIRDITGIVQAVINPTGASLAYQTAQTLRNEFVIEATGTVNKRPANLVNQKIPTGEIEIDISDIKVISEAKALPFDIADTSKINEESRLAYRYLDLRSKRMAHNLKLRHQIATFVRQYLNEHDFFEIETPLLTKTSPEGARDFLVPSRLQPGKFYALPQAPQQYKQLLMIAGLERYFQLAKALRDEDLRGDRQLEHTQIDLEMSFVTQDDVLNLVEGLINFVVESCGKTIWKKPFPRLTYDEAMAKFGADKFDLREDKGDPNVLAFAWVTDMPLFEWDEDAKGYTFAHNPFSAPKPEAINKVLGGENLGSLRAQQYDLVCNGTEIASGGMRITDPNLQKRVFAIMGLTVEEIEERFGHLLRAYEYGAPPHGGIAVGFDRLVMILANEKNIREVIPFPVTSSGTTAVMDAPSKVDTKQLEELYIKLDLPKNKR